MALKGNAGLRWTPPGGSETTHPLQHPLRLEAAPTLRRRRRVVDAWDYSSRTAFESSGSAEELRVRHRFEDFPRRLLRLLDHAAGGVQVDYYPDLDRSTVWPLLLVDASEDQSLDPDADRFGYGEYERSLRLRSADGTPLWPLYTPIGFTGAGEENLIRDAAMDADGDGDGVVDGFAEEFTNAGWSTAFDSGEGAQRLDYDGAGGGAAAAVQQAVLRVFAGDEVVASVDAKSDPTLDRRIRVRFFDADDTQVGALNKIAASSGSFGRISIAGPAPDGAAYARVRYWSDQSDDGTAGSGWFKNARLLRASSDPSAYANPHVDGASQTGTSLATAGWPASETNVVRAGDVIRCGGSGETQALADEVTHFFRAAEDVDSDGSGLATIPITVEIGAGNSPADGAALRLQHPVFV